MSLPNVPANNHSHQPPVSSILQPTTTESLLRIAVYGSGKQRRQALALLPPHLRREAQQTRHEQAWPER